MNWRICVGALLLSTGCSDDGVTAADTDPSTASANGTSSASDAPAGTESSPSGDSRGDTNATSTSADPASSDDGTTGSAGEGSTGDAPAPGEPVLYVAGGNAVTVWSLDEVGALSPVQQLDQGDTVGPLAAAGATHLYAARVGAQQVSAMTIDPATGALAEVAVTDVGHVPVYLSVDSGGRWLLSADFGGDLVQVRPLEADGSVGTEPSQTLDVQSRPHAILFDPGGEYVFVPHRDSNLIEQYLFDDTMGMLTPNDPPSVAAPEGAGPRHLTFAPDSSVAYVVNEFASSVTVYAYEAGTGLLTQGSTVSALPERFVGNNTGADIHVTPDGGTVYASMRGHDSLAILDVVGDGTLAYLGFVETPARPRAFGLGPFGEHVYAAGQDDGMLRGYTIDADGTLSPGALYDAGANAQWVLGLELPPS